MLNFIFAMLAAPVFMQSEGQCDSVYVYTPNNKIFERILKDFIEEEKKYSYFDSNSTFTIFIQKNAGLTNLLIISDCNQPSSIKIESSKIFTNETRPLIGVLEFTDHLFFITGQQEKNQIDSNIMKQTGKTYQFFQNKKQHKFSEAPSYSIDDTQCEKIWYCIFDNYFKVLDKIYNNYSKKEE